MPSTSNENSTVSSSRNFRAEVDLSDSEGEHVISAVHSNQNTMRCNKVSVCEQMESEQAPLYIEQEKYHLDKKSNPKSSPGTTSSEKLNSTPAKHSSPRKILEDQPILVRIGPSGQHVAYRLNHLGSKKSSDGSTIVAVRWQSNGAFEWIEEADILGPEVQSPKRRRDKPNRFIDETSKEVLSPAKKCKKQARNKLPSKENPTRIRASPKQRKKKVASTRKTKDNGTEQKTSGRTNGNKIGQGSTLSKEIKNPDALSPANQMGCDSNNQAVPERLQGSEHSVFSTFDETMLRIMPLPHGISPPIFVRIGRYGEHIGFLEYSLVPKFSPDGEILYPIRWQACKDLYWAKREDLIRPVICSHRQRRKCVGPDTSLSPNYFHPNAGSMLMSNIKIPTNQQGDEQKGYVLGLPLCIRMANGTEYAASLVVSISPQVSDEDTELLYPIHWKADNKLYWVKCAALLQTAGYPET